MRLVLRYLRVGDTHLLHVCRQLVDVIAELFDLLRERLQHLLLLELGTAVRLVSDGNCAGYWRRVLFVTHAHTLRDSSHGRVGRASVVRVRSGVETAPHALTPNTADA